MESGRLENVFGAVALAAFDAISESVVEDVARTGANGAALNLVGHIPGASIDTVARGLGLSHPGTVRVVDRLVEAGLVTRTSSVIDRRSVELYLTAIGTRTRRSLLRGRNAAIEDFLAPLSTAERRQLDNISAKLLRANVRNIPDALGTCRFCDERVCIDCPVNASLAAGQ